MTTSEIAERLVAHCRQGKWEAAQHELYAADAVSLENKPSPMMARESRGLAAIIEKGRKFEAAIEQYHAIAASLPLVAGDAIAFTLLIDVTMKGRGRMQLAEICVYQVNDGKIVSEQFFN